MTKKKFWATTLFTVTLGVRPHWTKILASPLDGARGGRHRPDQLKGDVLYYGDNHSSVIQLHCRDDVEALMEEHRADGKLLVLDVSLKHCGPCVKVYPTTVKLSRSMMDTVVFARMNGDENESCLQFLKDMEVLQVPTFLFVRDKNEGGMLGLGKESALVRMGLMTARSDRREKSKRELTIEGGLKM